MDPAILIPIAGMMVPLVIAPTAIVAKHLSRKRELEHQERMRALDLGQPVPRGNAWPALVCIALGAGVPIGAFGFAWLSVLSHTADDKVFIPAMIVGVAGVISGMKLAGNLLGAKPAAEPAHTLDARKPEAYDPDAFDVVGRRG